jgi:3,4-dihydroxy 2-butanone 4-phosphate synthase/GTP cyclohydrolase II
MARYGRGLICLSMTPERLDELEIPLMVSQNSSKFDTAFCVPIEARERTSTGISAADRAATVLTAIDPATRPIDLLRPGHMFPLRSRTGGVLVRTGQTEASVDIARIAGLYPAGVICEVMNEDGTMARAAARQGSQRHGLLMVTVADLINYRMRTESMRNERPRPGCRPISATSACTFESQVDSQTHVARARGHWRRQGRDGARPPSCLTGDGCTRSAATAVCSSARRWRRSPPRPRHPAVFEPGGARHRLANKIRARAPGTKARHGRSERAARVQGRSARLRYRRPDPARARRAVHAPEQQPRKLVGIEGYVSPSASGCRWRFPRRSRRAAI